jgi:hypothetical protein
VSLFSIFSFFHTIIKSSYELKEGRRINFIIVTTRFDYTTPSSFSISTVGWLLATNSYSLSSLLLSISIHNFPTVRRLIMCVYACCTPLVVKGKLSATNTDRSPDSQYLASFFRCSELRGKRTQKSSRVGPNKLMPRYLINIVVRQQKATWIMNINNIGNMGRLLQYHNSSIHQSI